jgi:alcohol dehydrogenase
VLGAVIAGAHPIVAVDVADEKLEAALRLGATDAVLWAGGPEETAERVTEVSGGGVDYAIEATGRTDAARAAFLATRARGAAVLIGIPAADAELSLPALSIPRMERRVLGSVYGSARPERDFPALLELYRRGRLPLDRLVGERLPLDAVGEAFDRLRDGALGRVVLDMHGAAA